MVKEHDTFDDDVEVTGDDPDAEPMDTDIETATIEKTAQDKIKKLQSQLQEVTKEKQHLNEQLQRAKADHLNARKRLETEKQEGIDRAKVRFIENLLPVCDSFRMAMADQAVWEQVDERWRKGIEGIMAQLNSVLDSYQVRELEPMGETFDPHKHEALSEESVSSKSDVNTVRQVVQPGYEAVINGTVHLVRPARVIVGVPSESEQADSEIENEN